MPRHPGFVSVQGSAAFGAMSEGWVPSEALAAVGAVPEEDFDHSGTAKWKDRGVFQPLQACPGVTGGKEDAGECQTKSIGDQSEEMLHGSDQVLGLLVLVDQGVLLLNLTEDGDLGLDMLGLHEQLGTVDQSIIPCVVEAVGTHAEGVPDVGLQGDLLLVPHQLVVAVGRGAVLLVDGLMFQNGGGDLLVHIVLVDDLGVEDFHGALGAEDLEQGLLTGVGVGGVDLHLVDGAARVDHGPGRERRAAQDHLPHGHLELRGRCRGLHVLPDALFQRHHLRDGGQPLRCLRR